MTIVCLSVKNIYCTISFLATFFLFSSCSSKKPNVKDDSIKASHTFNKDADLYYFRLDESAFVLDSNYEFYTIFKKDLGNYGIHSLYLTLKVKYGVILATIKDVNSDNGYTIRTWTRQLTCKDSVDKLRSVVMSAAKVSVQRSGNDYNYKTTISIYDGKEYYSISKDNTPSELINEIDSMFLLSTLFDFSENKLVDHYKIPRN